MKNRLSIYILIVMLAAIATICFGQVYLGVSAQIEKNEFAPIINSNPLFGISHDGYLYQFEGTKDGYYGNYRIAVLSDKETKKSYIVIFNDRSVTMVERN